MQPVSAEDCKLQHLNEDGDKEIQISKNSKKKSLRKELERAQESFDGSPGPAPSVNGNTARVVDAFHELNLSAHEHSDIDKKKKRTRRRPRKPKEQYGTEIENCKRSGSSNSARKVIKNVNKCFDDPTNDILELQKIYFKINGVVLNDDQAQDLLDASTSEPDHKLNESHTASKSRTKENISESKSKNKEKIKFEKYLSREDVLIGLQNKSLFEGSLRINAKCYQQAYVNNPDKKKSDILINGLKDRNRALEDDIVVIELLKASETSDKLTGKVVFIKEYVHSRTCIGNLKLNQSNKNEATFFPRDKRMPIMSIPMMDCPPSFEKEYKSYENTLFCAKIVNWMNTKYILGTLLANVGQSHDLKTQTKAILLENDLDVQPFGSEFKHLYPDADISIPAEELKYREDFRNCCVFTIDPLTARDLDDAVSCRVLDNGNYEIGVHISDVTYYLKEGNNLNDQVAKKATTVYLVDGTYHMLPKDLCLHCSLLPGCDKLTFSVVWEISDKGEIVNHRFTRSIINSCCQLAYDHAQVMLENPDKVLAEDTFPQILGHWTLKDIQAIVNRLFKLSVIFKLKRFAGGALRIDQPKLTFKLDPSNGFPLNYRIEEHNESHSLIEEFMLLANCTVAARIYEDFPHLAFLRLHPPPKNTLEAVAENFNKIGIKLDISSAGELQTSLAKFLKDDLFSKAKSMVLQTHLIKTLSRALYFCAEGHDDDDIRHYSLNIPIYTHFTSPIRRYADIVVHRLLSASLEYTPRPQWKPDFVQNAADNCNKQKYSAKRAGDMSSELYLMKYISINSPLVEDAAVLDVFENSLDVIILSMGLVKRIYFDNFSDDKTTVTYAGSTAEGTPNRATVHWESTKSCQTLQIFSVVRVKLEKTDDLMIVNTRIVRPTSDYGAVM